MEGCPADHIQTGGGICEETVAERRRRRAGEEGMSVTGSDDAPWGEAGWPFRRVDVRCVVALGDRPMSITELSDETGHSRKAVRRTLKRLGEWKLVDEVEDCSGSHRVHRLTAPGHRLSERISTVLGDVVGSPVDDGGEGL